LKNSDKRFKIVVLEKREQIYFYNRLVLKNKNG
jgi:hypothetical protein